MIKETDSDANDEVFNKQVSEIADKLCELRPDKKLPKKIIETDKKVDNVEKTKKIIDSVKQELKSLSTQPQWDNIKNPESELGNLIAWIIITLLGHILLPVPALVAKEYYKWAGNDVSTQMKSLNTQISLLEQAQTFHDIISDKPDSDSTKNEELALCKNAIDALGAQIRKLIANPQSFEASDIVHANQALTRGYTRREA